MRYEEQLSALAPPSFDAIRQVASARVQRLAQRERDQAYRQLQRGIALLESDEQLCQYLYSYGKMHQAKLLDAFRQLPDQLFQKAYQIIDWGGGQAMGTVNLFDFIRSKGLPIRAEKVTLIEPSKQALERAVMHTSLYVTEKMHIIPIASFFEEIKPEQIQSSPGTPVIHIFSNILDVSQIDLKKLATLIDGAVVSDNYLVCVGPLNPTNLRIDSFYRYFDVPVLYDRETYTFLNDKWTYKCKLFQLSHQQQSHLFPIRFYPAVPFQAAYELDMVRQARTAEGVEFDEELVHFEITAPFDLGASVYDDVHPILAVLNNLITRGVPTKASPFVERAFASAFGLSAEVSENGELFFPGSDEFLINPVKEYIQGRMAGIAQSGRLTREMQLFFSPIAIARFQKVLVEAIITGHLSLETAEWRIMVEERDVPFAALALEDFKQLFRYLTELSSEYTDLKLPEICLYIQSNEAFKDSPLHMGHPVFTELPKHVLSETYDLVVSFSAFERTGNDSEAFSQFKCYNNCYFNIRMAAALRADRNIYTSDRIRYRDLVSRNANGSLINNEESERVLEYFLSLLFRKQSFRAGQLPILDRALKNLPVIGLLPTGGGKSLTYQLAALLQPGVTMVVDPLKSLMKDQLDGLRNNGIDCCALINSTLSKEEREQVEYELESSRLLFVFLSPERLSIQSFRERLYNMHSYNVYFSYGVIDEVHCVSEWGHDFRFSYLHLGRNLYQYVRAKNGEISLFGLTATASFDVLADVERELSGNGAFPLDADVVVRHENTDRLELQYKVEKVPVDFEPDSFFDQNGRMPAHLPKAVRIPNTFKAYDSKNAYLPKLIKAIPGYLNDLQTPAAVAQVQQRFAERHNVAEVSADDIRVAADSEFYKERGEYRQSGIVFCPHVVTTGVSVEKNRAILMSVLTDKIGSFSGKDLDQDSMDNLVRFRDNKLPIMVATKAFGMGIDKPNVRFTVNMNFSSSLESFVQEAGRAGRDRKMALATILFSDYTLARVNGSYTDNAFPMGIIRNKWFRREDLLTILSEYGLNVPEQHIDVVTPSVDMVKLHCSVSQQIFGFNECAERCNRFKGCTLAKVSRETKGWKTERELQEFLSNQGLKINRHNFEYLNSDYEAVMYFFNKSFKGEVVEKQYLVRLLLSEKLEVRSAADIEPIWVNGFLDGLVAARPGDKLVIYVPYTEEESEELNKAIYRMCCIELITDFTQDYGARKFRIIAQRLSEGGYFTGLETFLKRYYTPDRAALEIAKAKSYPVKGEGLPELKVELFQCLAYLTDFVYEKISEKRKRAIDDMRNFCLEGLKPGKSWIELNEDLKDFIFYYFNSKYANADYVADNGEPFSLVVDTDGGKLSDEKVLFKYLRVISDELVGSGTPLDNIKHLLGAVRYIKRSLTDTNPTIALLEVFCLIYLGSERSETIRQQITELFGSRMIDLFERYERKAGFWSAFDKFLKAIKPYLSTKDFAILKEETQFLIHAQQLNVLASKYLSNNDK